MDLLSFPSSLSFPSLVFFLSLLLFFCRLFIFSPFSQTELIISTDRFLYDVFLFFSYTFFFNYLFKIESAVMFVRTVHHSALISRLKSFLGNKGALGRGLHRGEAALLQVTPGV